MGRKSLLSPEYETLRQKLITIAISHGEVSEAGNTWSSRCKDWFNFRVRNQLPPDEIEAEFMDTVFAGGDANRTQRKLSASLRKLIQIAMDNGYTSRAGKTWHVNARDFVMSRINSGMDEKLIVEQFMNSHFAGNTRTRQFIIKINKTFRNQILERFNSNGYHESTFNKFWEDVKHLSQEDILIALNNSRFINPNPLSEGQRHTTFLEKYRKLVSIAVDNGYFEPSNHSQPGGGVKKFIKVREESHMSYREIESDFMQSRYIHPRNVDEIYREIRLELTPIIRDQNGWIQEKASDKAIKSSVLMMIRRKLDAGWEKEEVIDYLLNKSRYSQKNPALLMKEYLSNMKETANKLKSVFAKYNLSYTMFNIQSYDKPTDYDQVKVIKKVVKLITKEFDATLAKIWSDMITKKLEAA